MASIAHTTNVLLAGDLVVAKRRPPERPDYTHARSLFPHDPDWSRLDHVARAAAMGALGQTGIVAFDLDRALHVSARTERADSWLARVAQWRIKNDRLVCQRPTIHAQLENLVENALDDARAAATLQWNERGELVVGVVKAATYFEARPMARLFVLTMRSHFDAETHERLWQLVWDLTAQECRVAEQLVWGGDGSAIAKSLGISTNTVKFHVRGLLAKTASRRRSELVARLVAVQLPVS
jgi:DNA-binding CsgD family transcriptional regulator